MDAIPLSTALASVTGYSTNFTIVTRLTASNHLVELPLSLLHGLRSALFESGVWWFLTLWVPFLVLMNVLSTWRTFKNASMQHASHRLPPVLPYLLPVVGPIMALVSYWNSRDPISWILSTRIFKQAHPIRVNILNNDVYFAQGPDNVKQIFKNSWTCTLISVQSFVLGRVFGMSNDSLKLYDRDNSGYRGKPRPGTNVDPHNRIEFLTYRPLIKHLTGAGMKAFWYRYENELIEQLRRLPSSTEWTHMPDLTRIFEGDVSVANTKALCGPHLLQRHPDFVDKLWKLDHHIDVLFRGTPRIFAPRVYAQRDRLLEAVKDWQAHARENFDESCVDENGDDPFWGSSIFRERNETFAHVDGMDDDAKASEDFGVIWSATRNSVVAAFWTVLEIFRDAKLLAKVREEVESCRTTTGSGFDINLLLEKPLLQSIYSEVLRLRVHMLIPRIPHYEDLHINEWVIPMGKMLVISSTVAHMDGEVWNAGANNEHPLDTFWAERFLKYENIPGSGPRKSDIKGPRGANPGKAVYAIEDVEGSWIPYGGGTRICPGRHFAKRDIIFTAAVMVTYFDIEILADVRSLPIDMRGFALGTMSVSGEVPYKIRRRSGAGW
ncbi:Cytochrome P450 monooxygenase calL-like protein [Cladobotryum mycophilum]|uniref:Cytochrome P450 monooxygenase calL-like protein n=1 Tax=Cladobotryum mycophilum TaxID=491253 RepID=A0ABR0SP78_9HYPO